MSNMILTFFKGKKGDVISRLPSGKIVVIDRRARNKPLPGEKWEVEIEEKERVAIARPLHRIVKKQVLTFAEYKCGHREQLDDGIKEFIELSESKEPEPRIIHFDRLCQECSKRFANTDLKDVVNIEILDALYFSRTRELESKITELENKKHD